MRNVCLTLDYELYGNGSGDVFENLIKPTDALVVAADKFGYKYTFFFEVVEYWRIKEEWERGNSMGYDNNPIEAIDNQIKRLYALGHDVQLHIHPQWVNAFYSDNQWNVDFSQWRLGTYDLVGELSLENLLKKGIETLEYLFRPVNSNYKCFAIRAGGYNADPSEKMVEVMRKLGLSLDSSIYPGGKETGCLSCYDYTRISTEEDHWHCVSSLKEKSKDGDITELPIVAYPIVRWKKYFTRERIKSLLNNRKSASDAFASKTSNAKHGLYSKVAYFFEKEYQTWDFCLFNNRLHSLFLKKSNNRVFITLVGHPKSYVSDKSLIKLFQKLKKQGDKVLTITEAYRKIRIEKN